MQADFWCLSHLDDAQLLASTQRTLARGRELTAELVAHLSAVEERRLHLHAACSSMFDYCVSRLGLSEDENRSPSGPPIEPLAPGRYKIQLSASSELKQKLEQCRDLMRHANPSGDFAPIFERALDLLLDKLMRERFGAARRPRIAKKTSGERIDHATRREVTARDGLRCTWTGCDGERCHATGWLELDHEQPFAKGGGSGANNVRVLCRAHNQLAVELEFGRETIHRAISERRRLAREPG